MLLIFFGGQVFINQMAPLLGYDQYIDINPFIAGISTIGFIFGAYMTETFRGAILAVNQGQLEAGMPMA
jgi:arginine/ornithine transport system permease protein